MTPKILIVYASRHGHTATIARRVAGAAGHDSDVVEVGQAADFDVRDYAGVAVIGSIHIGRHDARLVHWVVANRAALQMRPTVLLCASLTAVDDPAAAREYIDQFVEDTGWTPSRSLTVAGALQYRAYGFLTRQMVRQIAAKKGLSTDIHRDTEYTDWNAVADIARWIGDRAAAARPAALA